MRVICTNNDKWDLGHGPNKDDIDEVIDEESHWGQIFYALERFGMDDLFDSKFFIPLSDFTIEELIGERELVEV